MSMNASDRLSATFLALADPTRRAILARLAEGEASVAELAEPFLISQPAISKHLRMLERAGLISVGQDGQRRPRRIEAAPLAEASAWLERYRQLWEASYERLDALLDELKRAPAEPPPRSAPTDALREPPAHERGSGGGEVRGSASTASSGSSTRTAGSCRRSSSIRATSAATWAAALRSKSAFSAAQRRRPEARRSARSAGPRRSRAARARPAA